MSDTDVIKEFMISLGFKADEASQKKFANNIAWATAKVNALAQAVFKASEVVYDAGKDFVKGMEGLYYASQRTGASVTGIESFAFAVESLGGTAEGAMGSLEAIGRFMRNTPGAESFISSLGVQTRAANGELRKTDEVMVEIGKQLAKMDMPHANAYANVLGIDEKTLLAMRSGEFEKAYERRKKLASGADFEKAAKQSMQFMNSLRDIGAQFTVMAARGEAAVLDRVLPALQKFSQWLDSPSVQQFLNGVFAAAMAGLGFTADLLKDAWKALTELIPEIDFSDTLDALKDAMGALWKVTKTVGEGLLYFFGPSLKAAIQGIADVVQLLAQGLGAVGNLITGDTDKLAARGSKIGDLAGNLLSDFQGIGKGILGAVGIETGPQVARNASIQQTTNINVHGTDAPAIGRAVAGEQDRVNQRTLRNAKGILVPG